MLTPLFIHPKFLKTSISFFNFLCYNLFMGLGNSNIWIENLQKYRGKWVALDEDEKTVVASDEKAKNAYNSAVKKGVKLPILFKVPSVLAPYIGSFS